MINSKIGKHKNAQFTICKLVFKLKFTNIKNQKIGNCKHAKLQHITMYIKNYKNLKFLKFENNNIANLQNCNISK